MKQINLITIAIALIAMTSIFTACGDSDTFTDPRDGQKYKTVKIGDQVWMAEDLKYKEAEGVYSWDSALVACPEGWHLPNKAELETVASDTNFKAIWSSTERDDFTLKAYGVARGEIESFNKDGDWLGVRCVLGKEQIFNKLDVTNGYKAIRVGKQIWMADNLNLATPNSICYHDDESECYKGRYYPFSEAYTICPKGWHLPSKSEAAMFINKLAKEKSSLKTTQGYYVLKGEKFSKSNGWGMLWTSTFGFVMTQSNGEPEIWNGEVYIRKEGWKIAVRCIADSENKE